MTNYDADGNQIGEHEISAIMTTDVHRPVLDENGNPTGKFYKDSYCMPAPAAGGGRETRRAERKKKKHQNLAKKKENLAKQQKQQPQDIKPDDDQQVPISSFARKVGRSQLSEEQP